MKNSDDLEKTKAYFVDNWKLLLKHLLRWSDKRINAWIRARLIEWENPGLTGWIIHEAPTYLVVLEMLSPRAKSMLGARRFRIYRKLEWEILNDRRKATELSEADWVACRKRVNRLLSIYGQKLPTTDRSRTSRPPIKRLPEEPSIESACKKLEGLSIYADSKARKTFFNVAIEYASQELSAQGIDLLRVTNRRNLDHYCQAWFKTTRRTDTDLALIALSFAIEYDVQKALKDRKRAGSEAK